jgi:hypothetical protein
MTHNLVFVSSLVSLSPNLGSATAYDARCNELATKAGINSTAGDAFVAWISDSHSTALSRLGTARGFVRMDGQPVADDLGDLVAGHRMFYPISLHETGAVRLPIVTVLTGMDILGNADPMGTCDDWTSTSSAQRVTAGAAGEGPVTWYFWENGTCDMITGAVYCFMKTQTAELTPTPAMGRKIFLSNGPVLSTESADARCDSSKPAGVGAVIALRATTTASASSLLTPDTTFVRPDGTVVGRTADLLANHLTSGIWQQGDGTYIENRSIWTGAASPSSVATAATNCSDWTSTLGEATAGASPATGGSWWSNLPVSCSSTYTWSLCVER